MARLQLVGHSHQHRIHRHRGFPAADITLQQPIHRPATLQIAHDFPDGVLLRFGKRKREPLANSPVQRFVDPQHRCGQPAFAKLFPNT